jgi:hypothetical protein
MSAGHCFAEMPSLWIPTCWDASCELPVVDVQVPSCYLSLLIIVPSGINS